LVFTGTYERTIDAKNRLAIPAEIRPLLQRQSHADAGQPVSLYATIGENRTLCLYTVDGFEKRAHELDHSELDPDELLAFERMLFSLSRLCEVDGNGRIRLPEQLVRMSSLGEDTKEVVILGVKDHLELKPRDAWMDEVERLLHEQPQLLMNPRRAMRKRSTRSTSSDASDDRRASESSANAGAGSKEE